jgi:AcrR family transcriptional regulator
MAKSRASDKDQALIEAAITLFLTKGVRGTRIADIAQQAGVAVGTVYLYHPDKKSIIRRVAYAFAEQHHTFAQGVLSSRRKPLAKLEAYVVGLYDMWRPFGTNDKGPIELADSILTLAAETVGIAQKEFQTTVTQILQEAKAAGLRVQSPKQEAHYIALSTSAFFPLAGTPDTRPLSQSTTRKDLVNLLRWLGRKMA